MRIYCKVYGRAFFRFNAVTVGNEQSFLTVHRPDTVRRDTALTVQITFHLRLDTGFSYNVVTRVPEWRKILIRNAGNLTYITDNMAGIKGFRGICPHIFLTRNKSHVMVILLFDLPDELIRNVSCDLNGRTLNECPVICKYLISYPYDPVRFFDRIIVVDVEFPAQIKEENVRIGLNVIIRERNDNAR